MARPRSKADGPAKPRRKSARVEDEEISEDEAFDEQDEAKYGRFFQSKRPRVSEETGELWNYLIEGADEDEGTCEKDDAAAAEKPAHKSSPAPADDSDGEFTRLEEDADLFTEDTTLADIGGFEWITEPSEGDAKYASLISKFREIREDLPEVFREESRAKASREERKELYASVQKGVSKRWEPVLQHLKRQKHIAYGEADARSDPTCGSLTQLEAETELEKELAAQANVAHERALHARELRKQKRVNRIKSKNWHKRQKKRDLELYAKLIEKSNDPELTKELLESFEQKRSKHRVLRKRAAQEKWAKLAMRFGDRSVLKQISSAQQQLKNDLSLIKETIDSVAQRDGSDSASDTEGESAVSDAESDSGDPQDEVLAKLKIIANPTEESVPQKGLFALKFMKDVLQSKIARQAEAGEPGSDSPHAVALRDQVDDDYQQESLPSESDDDLEPPADPADTIAPTSVPAVSDDDLKRAMRQIQQALGGASDDDEQDTGFAAPEPLSTRQTAGQAPTDQETRGDPSTEPHDTQAGTPQAPKPTPGHKTHATDHPVATLLSEDAGLDNFIKRLGPAKKRENTLEVAQRLFVTRPDDEAQLSAGEESDPEAEASDQLKGWGSWTGFGIVDVKPAKPAPAAPQKMQKRTLKVSNKKDPKLAKYLLHRVRQLSPLSRRPGPSPAPEQARLQRQDGHHRRPRVEHEQDARRVGAAKGEPRHVRVTSPHRRASRSAQW
ncbi:U3 SMALL NUCLEOLAR RNA-ASSOCIATED PROTEIN, putative [Babesia caballi]|uniref:U3 SMALL NUCLEOLAR RNA-ASSOCIATED PROTEIN, putative n=1 Tax=Babesia caballi TaxID=5871 RepID=A0AAV4LS59_BABCB|nr:U3 SMALL NUCLEOLAR RNA-ASSOCIATED PROTEIN, putative [Babesia caballi]